MSAVMLLWYSGVSVLGVLTIFRSVGIDYRLVALGALVPLVIDAPLGRPAFGHALLSGVGLLALVMLTTIGRPRLTRRRLLCLPIGAFCGLVLSGAWTRTDVLWWPTLGIAFPSGNLLPAWWVVALEELAGLLAWWWVAGTCDLYLRGPRREFVRTGRLRATGPAAEG